MHVVSYANLNYYLRLVIIIVISHLVLGSSAFFLFLVSSLSLLHEEILWNKPSQVALTSSCVEKRIEPWKDTHWELSYLSQLVKR